MLRFHEKNLKLAVRISVLHRKRKRILAVSEVQFCLIDAISRFFFSFQGRAIPLRANHFQITMPRGYIHHYHISITPDKCPRKVNRDIIGKILEYLKKMLKVVQNCAK